MLRRGNKSRKRVFQYQVVTVAQKVKNCKKNRLWMFCYGKVEAHLRRFRDRLERMALPQTVELDTHKPATAGNVRSSLFWVVVGALGLRLGGGGFFFSGG